MPKYCLGLEDPAGGESRPCIFAQDGNGGRAQTSSGKRHCALCSLENLDQAFGSLVGKGNLQRQLKHWRRVGSPTYEAAFALGALAALSAGEQQLLRAKAGERGKFWKQSSWLHKRRLRLRHFLLGRPIPVANLSPRSHRYLQTILARKGEGWLLHYNLARLRKKEPFANVRSKHNGRTYWRGRPADMRKGRSAWWRIRRILKAKCVTAVARGPPFDDEGLAWAMDEGILQRGALVALSGSQESNPSCCYLTEAGDSLFFTRLSGCMTFPTKQLASAECSVRNVLGGKVLGIDMSEAQRLLTDRGYVWETHLLSYASILAPLVLDTCLQRAGFKLELWNKHTQWPAQATGILQIRGAAQTKFWAALRACEDRVYMLDCFLSEPTLITNWHHALQVNETYAVVPVQARDTH